VMFERQDGDVTVWELSGAGFTGTAVMITLQDGRQYLTLIPDSEPSGEGNSSVDR
jgi:hypothetical protein